MRKSESFSESTLFHILIILLIVSRSKAKPKMDTYVYETVNQNISTNNKLQIY